MLRARSLTKLNCCRSYIGNNYQSVKDANPDLPFLVRECDKAQPCVTARYEFGIERKIYLLGANEAEVGQAVTDLVGQADAINKAAAPRF